MGLIKSIEWKSSVHTETENLQDERKRFSVTKLVPEPPPLSVFDVNQFLPDRIGRSSSFSYFRITCTALGIILILTGIYLRRKRIA